MGDERVHKRAGSMPGGRMDDETCGFVDDDQTVVLVDDGDPGAGRGEGQVPLMLGLREHRVEDSHRVTGITKHGCGVERAQRRVRLLGLPGLGVEAKVVALADEEVRHRLKPSKSWAVFRDRSTAVRRSPNATKQWCGWLLAASRTASRSNFLDGCSVLVG